MNGQDFNPFVGGQVTGNAMAYPPQDNPLWAQILQGLNTGLGSYAAAEQGGMGGLAQYGSGVLSAFADKKKQEWEDSRKRQLEQEKFLTDSVHDIVKKYQGQDLSNYPELTGLMDKYRGALAAESPGGVLITPKEAMEIIAWDTRVGKEAQGLQQDINTRKLMEPYRAKEQYGVELIGRMQPPDMVGPPTPEAQAAQSSYEAAFPKPFLPTSQGWMPPDVAKSIFSSEARAAEGALNRETRIDVARIQAAASAARSAATGSRQAIRLQQEAAQAWQQGLINFISARQRNSFEPVDPARAQQDFIAIAGPPPSAMLQGPPGAAPAAPQSPAAGGLDISSMSPTQQQKIMTAPDGTEFELKGRRYQKQGNTLVPIQ